MVMPAGKEVKANMIGKQKIEPMKKVMVVPYDKAPKDSLSKDKIQEDLLIIGNKYRISTRLVNEKNGPKLKGEVMRLIACYPNHYLFKTKNGIKHSFSKVNYCLGEWEIEECK